MDDESRTVCLSPDCHDENIKDHLLHFLGCIEISERHDFLNDHGYKLWEQETKHWTTKLQQAEDEKTAEDVQRTARDIRSEARGESERKRKAWRDDCLSELRRIDYLRFQLKEDEQEKHLVESVEKSRDAWKKSKEYEVNIPKVRAWFASRRKYTWKEYEKSRDESEYTPYKPSRDVNAPFMQFEKTDPSKWVFTPVNETPDSSQSIWGRYPNQKTTVQRLLDPEEGQMNLLSKDKDEERLKYFHIPSNNMTWAEEAVSRYFDEPRPDFHAIKREIQKKEPSNAELVLKESHWRGQLHGGREIISSRYMRPFCEAISLGVAERPDADIVPKNIVLFMPYMHWETSRNRERFAQVIETKIADEMIKEKELEEEKKKERRSVRKGLERITPPTPQIIYREKKEAWHPWLVKKFRRSREFQSPPQGADQQERKEPDTDKPKVRIRTMTTLLKAQEQRKKLNISGNLPQVDKNGRVDLDKWIAKNGVQPSRRLLWCPAKRRPPETRFKLGQYLLDAARLFEGMTGYRDKKLLESFLMVDPPMHPRRTLDQAYYWSLNTTNSRDRDQVVYRATTADPLTFHRWDPDRCVWTGHGRAEGLTSAAPSKFQHEPCSDCTANIRKISRVVMVDQLWMWVLDEKTIITCFPKRYGANKHDTSGVHKSIRMRMAEGRHSVRSVFDLALVIFEECSNTFFDRTRTSDKQPQVLDEFSEAIGNIMHQQTVAFERLWRWTERAAGMYRSRPDGGLLSELHIPLLDINPEGKLEKEIKDIVEELGIMLYIKKAEKEVLECFVSHACRILNPGNRYEVQSPQAQNPEFRVEPLDRDYGTDPSTLARFVVRVESPSGNEGPAHSPHQQDDEQQKNKATYSWFKINADELLKRVDQRISQLQELERSAESTSVMVKDLLDLKQQQAGVVQAWQSVNQSNEAIRQGRSIMIFTIVTIVFLPLSFMSSIFGMNAIEFGGGDNTMHLSQQMTYMFSISTGVIVSTLLVSNSTSLRTLIWYIFTRLSTSLFVHTGLYRKVYLGVDLSSDKMYEHAVKATERLKAKEKEKYLEFRRSKREKSEGREKGDAEPGKNTAEGCSGVLHLLRSRQPSEAGGQVSSGDISQKV